MACGIAVKRQLIDLDGLHSPDHAAKRKRTSNICHHSPFHPAPSAFATIQSPSGSPKLSMLNLVAFSDDSSIQSTSNHKLPARNVRVTADDLYVALRRQLVHSWRQRGLTESPSVNGSESSSDGEQSPRREETSSMLDVDSVKLAKRQRRALILEAMTDGDHVDENGHSARDTPLFSVRQVQYICERLLKEQETRLTAAYDKTLNAKLAEQYDSFVRFTYDQIHRKYDDDQPMSYLS